MSKLLFPALLALFVSTNINSEPVPSSATTNAENVRAAEDFIEAFYSFKSHTLESLLTDAEESIPAIIYYQGWAKGGNYKILHRTPCKIEEPSLVTCSITVQDDLMLALGIDFNVTDTFHVSLDEGKISAVMTSSNDLQVFRDAQEWVTSKLPDLIGKPCEGFFNGGPTPGKCVQAMVEGYAKFAASEDFPTKPAP